MQWTALYAVPMRIYLVPGVISHAPAWTNHRGAFTKLSAGASRRVERDESVVRRR